MEWARSFFPQVWGCPTELVGGRHAQRVQVLLQPADPTPTSARERRAVVGQQPCRQAVAGGGDDERRPGVGAVLAGRHPQCQVEAGAVVGELQDHHRAPGGQLIVEPVQLPQRVRLVRLEPVPRPTRTPLRDPHDLTAPVQDPIDRGPARHRRSCRHRRPRLTMVADPERDLLRAGVPALLVELLAGPHDHVLDPDGDPARTTQRAPRARVEARDPLDREPGQVLVERLGRDAEPRALRGHIDPFTALHPRHQRRELWTHRNPISGHRPA